MLYFNDFDFEVVFQRICDMTILKRKRTIKVIKSLPIICSTVLTHIR